MTSLDIYEDGDFFKKVEWSLRDKHENMTNWDLFMLWSYYGSKKAIIDGDFCSVQPIPKEVLENLNIKEIDIEFKLLKVKFSLLW